MDLIGSDAHNWSLARVISFSIRNDVPNVKEKPAHKILVHLLNFPEVLSPSDGIVPEHIPWLGLPQCPRQRFFDFALTSQ